MMTNSVGTWCRVVAVIVLAWGATGCLTMSDPGTTMAITPGDMGKLSGQWQGTFTSPHGRAMPAALHINSDGTYTLRAEAYSSRGLTQVKDDKLVLVPDPPPSSGAPFRTATATLQMLPDGVAVLDGTGAGESGAFFFDVRRVSH